MDCTNCKWRNPNTCKACKQDAKIKDLDQERIIIWYGGNQ